MGMGMGKLLTITIATVCSIQLLLEVLRMPTPLPNESRAVTNKPEKLADGCYHVFLDVGSNIGNHARFLYEPSLYIPKQQSPEIFSLKCLVRSRAG